MVLVLLSAQPGCINMNFFLRLMCHNKTSCQKTVVDGPATVNNMRFLWSSAELQSVGKQLPVASSNDTFYRCHGLPPRNTSITAGCQKMWPLLSFISTPFNKHSLNLFLLMDFSPFPRCLYYTVEETVVKSLTRDLTLAWLWFPSKQCCVCASWVIEHYWFPGLGGWQ